MFRVIALPAFCLTALAADQVHTWHQKRSYSNVTVISTWPLKGPNDAAWYNLNQPEGSALSAVVAGCSAAEDDKAILSVGAGGSPDEIGDTTLSAMVMDGDSMDGSSMPPGAPTCSSGDLVVIGKHSNTMFTVDGTPIRLDDVCATQVTGSQVHDAMPRPSC
ncbi:hypothetical protein Aperf_G00000103730 [Anoplocephala perfoliata]